MDLEEFKHKVKTTNVANLVQEFVIDGHTYFFNEYYTLSDEYNLKKDIAYSLGIHFRDIIIVGSSKLGFSLKPNRETSIYEFNKFKYDSLSIDKNLNNSDIDIAIVSSTLFDDKLFELYKISSSYTDSSFFSSSYKYKTFAQYVLKGWIRPDKLPKKYELSTSILIVKNNLEEKYKIKINFGIYKSWNYLEQYHIDNMNNLKANLIVY